MKNDGLCPYEWHPSSRCSISIIGGVNFAMEMTPMLPPGVFASSSAPYTCGSAGGRFPRSGGVVACNWSFVPPSPEFYFVSAGGQACSASGAPCAPPLACGYALPGGSPRRFSRVCGVPWGYWSAGSICGSDSNDPLLACNATLPAPNAGLQLSNLYGCTSGASRRLCTSCCEPVS